MKIETNKQTAKALEKALFFSLIACYKREDLKLTELNPDGLKAIGIRKEDVINLILFLEKLKTQNAAAHIARVKRTKTKKSIKTPKITQK